MTFKRYIVLASAVLGVELVALVLVMLLGK